MTSLEKRTEYVFQNSKILWWNCSWFYSIQKIKWTLYWKAGYYNPYWPTERSILKFGKKINVNNDGKVKIKKLSNNEM